MIELKVEEYCHNCGAFQPEKRVQEYHVPTDDGERYTIENKVWIECARKNLCAGLVRYLKKEIEKNANVGK